MVTTSLPRMGTVPGTSNEPPGMRQETVSGQTQRVSLFSHQGIPHLGLKPQNLPVHGRRGSRSRDEGYCRGPGRWSTVAAQSNVEGHPVFRRLAIAETPQVVLRIRNGPTNLTELTPKTQLLAWRPF